MVLLYGTPTAPLSGLTVTEGETVSLPVPVVNVPRNAPSIGIPSTLLIACVSDKV